MLVAELNQTLLKGGQKFPHTLLKKVLKEVSEELKRKKTKTVSFAFVTPKVIKALNHAYRKSDCVTDVLSFELEDDDEIFGEILICYSQASKQAKIKKHSVRKEVTFLMVHGLLHLFGYDHEVEKDKKKMMKKQTTILERLGVNPEWEM